MSGADTQRAASSQAPQGQPRRAARPPRPGVEVRPFQALIYDRRRLPEPSAVLAPPYDVVDAAERQLLLERHPYNCVRLVLPQAPPGEPPEARYVQAGRLLRCWLCQGVLREMEEPAVFVLREEFELEGLRGPRRCQPRARAAEPPAEPPGEAQWYSRTSFIAAVALEPLPGGPIYPHEETMGEARRDRLALLGATRANLSLVMSFFADYGAADGEPGAVTAVLTEAQHQEPLLRAGGPAGVRLTLWAVTRSDLISRLTSEMAQRELFIADGHHRYETALAFARREEALGSPDPQGPGFIPMQCIPMEDRGLLALPTHRLFPAQVTSSLLTSPAGQRGTASFDHSGASQAPEVTASLLTSQAPRRPRRGSPEPPGGPAGQNRPSPLAADEESFLAQARQYFLVEEVEAPGLGLARLRDLMHRRRDQHVFGLYGRSRRAYLLRLRPEVPLDEFDMPYDPEVRRLDVCLFQELIVKRIFGMEFSQVAKDGTLRFVHSFIEGQQRVESGEIGLAFFVNPTPVAAIPTVAHRGAIVPPKSTYFYPKVPSGLLFRLIR